MRSRGLTLLAVAAAAALALVGCAPTGGTQAGAKAGGDGKLTVWSSFGGAQGDAIKAFSDSFAKSHPKDNVDLVVMSTDDLKQKVQAAVVSGSLPDVIQYYGGSSMKPLIDANALVPLDSYIKANKAWNDDLVKNWANTYTFTGKTYGVPVESPTVQLFYNRALLSKAGISSPPKTFDELLSAVGSLKKAGVIPISGDGKDGWPMQEFFTYLVMRNGGASALSDAFAGKLAWDSEVFLKSAKQLKQLADTGAFQDGYLGEGYDQLIAHYVNGEAGMTLTGSWFAGNLTAAKGDILQNTDFTAFPTVPGGKGTVTEAQGGPNASFSVTRNADNRDAAWEFVKGLTSNKVAKQVAQTANVVVPNNITLESSAPPILAKLFKQQAKYTAFNLFWNEVFSAEQNTHYTDLQNSMLAGSITPDQMVAQFADYMKSQK